MTDEITMDRIIKMLHEITGFKADASQIDAVRVAMETYAARLAQSYASSPSELTEAHLNSLMSLASQLLDTGGRMRLHPHGQLDVPENPLATRGDLAPITAGIAAQQKLIQDGLKAQRPADLTQVYGRLDDIDEWLSDRLTSLQAQLESLAKTVVAAQAAPQQQDIAAQLAALNDKFAALTAREMSVPSDDASPASVMISTGNGISPAVPLRNEALTDSLRIIGEMKTKAKAQAKHRPGCFFNGDGTITCRDCGKPKAPELFYKDARAWTGHKAACKDCEALSKRKTPVF